MKEEKDKLRDFMQEAFNDYEVAPDPTEWDRIEKTLQKGKRRRYILWAVWPVAASLLVLVALYLGGVLSHSGDTSTGIAINRNPQGKQLPTSMESKDVPTINTLKTSSANKQAIAIQPSDDFQKGKVKTIASSTVRESKNVNETKIIHNTTKIIQKGTNIILKGTNSQLGRNKNKKPYTGLDQEFKTPETESTLLATAQTKRTSVVPSPLTSMDISNAQPYDSLNALRISDLLVHTIKPRPIEIIRSNRIPINYNLLDLLQEPGKGYLSGNVKDELANNVSSIRFKGLSLSNSSGLQMQNSSEQKLYSTPFASQLASTMYLNSVKVFDKSYLSSLDIGNLFQNKNHNYIPPITFGLNVNLSLQGNWSVETGIQYTKLQSNGDVSISSSNSVQFITNFSYKVEESMHYLGVPIIINYSFSQNRKTSFYISAGLSIEKGIIAKYKATPEDKIPGMEPIYSHNAIKELQYSANSGIGISYKFIKHFELFAQPSVVYYFNPKGNSTTIYSIHPLLFNLRSGIRYSIK